MRDIHALYSAFDSDFSPADAQDDISHTIMDREYSHPLVSENID